MNVYIGSKDTQSDETIPQEIRDMWKANTIVIENRFDSKFFTEPCSGLDEVLAREVVPCSACSDSDECWCARVDDPEAGCFYGTKA